MYANVSRWNEMWGLSDFTINAITLFIGKASIIALSVVPMTSLMMRVVPSNIEASMFAVIGSILSLSTDWLGDVMGGLICNYFKVTDSDYSNFSEVLRVKQLCVMIAMTLSFILPTDYEVSVLARKIDHLEGGD